MVWATDLKSRTITTTCPLYGEPLKKKRKMDPNLLKHKVDRKIKKLEKSIRKLMKTPKQLKPLSEYQLPTHVQKELKVRTRKDPETAAITQTMEKLNKIWDVYRMVEAKMEMKSIHGVVAAQDKALERLKSHSEHLHRAALDLDHGLVPFNDPILVTHHPKSKDYTPPDGQQKDVTKQWSM
jgi:large subunit ribosomal protein L40